MIFLCNRINKLGRKHPDGDHIFHEENQHFPLHSAELEADYDDYDIVGPTNDLDSTSTPTITTLITPVSTTLSSPATISTSTQSTPASTPTPAPSSTPFSELLNDHDMHQIPIPTTTRYFSFHRFRKNI